MFRIQSLARHSGLALSALFLTVGCSGLYYKTMEAFGYQKWDLLVENVEDARDAQNDAKEQFKTALEQFTSVVQFDGGELESKYNQLSAELKRSEGKADAVRQHIASVENVAEALFEEWQENLGKYSSARLRSRSEELMRDTQGRYSQLITAMKRAEAKIDPVLSAFRDQVLFLGDNLKAKAIASLRDELVSVETDIESLIKEMEASVAEADAFINESLEAEVPS